MRWLRNLNDRIHQLRTKQIVLGILCALLFISPGILAVVNIYHINHQQNDQTMTVSLYNSDGTEVGVETGDPTLAEEQSLLSIFYQLDLLKDPLGGGSHQPPSDIFVRATLSRGQETTELICYFSTSVSSGICVDQEGNYFIIDPDVNQRFLSSPYGAEFFVTSVPPTLVTVEGDTISPATLSWNYKGGNDQFFPTQRKIPLSTNETYEITEEIDVHFSIPPDQCQVTVREGDAVLFSGHYSLLSNLTVNTDNLLHVSISANWLKTDQALCYGNITYEFYVRIKDPSVFSLNTDSAYPGSLLILSCTNVSSPQRIQFSSPQLAAPHGFYQDGSLCRALLVVPEDLAEKEIKIQVSYGASAQEFTLSVSEAQPKESLQYPTLDLSDSPLPSINARAYCQRMLSELLPLSDQQTIYFRGNTQSPLLHGFHKGYTHESTVYWGSDLKSSFLAHGTEYLAETGLPTRVSVWDHGIVLESGTDELLGNYVVVDHGGGVLTWYGHLSTYTVSKGDVVRQGDSIGLTGDTGLSTANGYLFLCSIHSQFIDPAVLYEGASLSK